MLESAELSPETVPQSDVDRIIVPMCWQEKCFDVNLVLQMPAIKILLHSTTGILRGYPGHALQSMVHPLVSSISGNAGI